MSSAAEWGASVMNVIDLSGSPRTMGEAFGELLRSEIH